MSCRRAGRCASAGIRLRTGSAVVGQARSMGDRFAGIGRVPGEFAAWRATLAAAGAAWCRVATGGSEPLLGRGGRRESQMLPA
jgi:hypothetical protein